GDSYPQFRARGPCRDGEVGDDEVAQLPRRERRECPPRDLRGPPEPGATELEHGLEPEPAAVQGDEQHEGLGGDPRRRGAGDEPDPGGIPIGRGDGADLILAVEVEVYPQPDD